MAGFQLIPEAEYSKDPVRAYYFINISLESYRAGLFH
jgi:hypothetical protein